MRLPCCEQIINEQTLQKLRLNLSPLQQNTACCPFCRAEEVMEEGVPFPFEIGRSDIDKHLLTASEPAKLSAEQKPQQYAQWYLNHFQKEYKDPTNVEGTATKIATFTLTPDVFTKLKTPQAIRRYSDRAADVKLNAFLKNLSSLLYEKYSDELFSELSNTCPDDKTLIFSIIIEKVHISVNHAIQTEFKITPEAKAILDSASKKIQARVQEGA